MLSGKSMARTRPTALGSQLQASCYGLAIPSIYGCVKSPLLVIWAQNLRQGGSGKKAKKKGVTTYVEQIDFLIGSNPMQGLLQFWGNRTDRYPLNFVKQRSAFSSFTTTITISDSEFYFVVGVTAEVSLSGTFNDYGGQGSVAWGPTTYEYPLWNKALHGPDLVNASTARWIPWTYKWVPGDGNVVTLPDLPLWPDTLPTNGFINIYYAQLAAANKFQVPAATFRLTFEPQLGNNNAAFAGYTAQQIIYPEYAGASSPNIDLGATGMIQGTRAEVMGSFSVYSRGDADFFDMIEDVLKSGMLQVGAQLGLIQRGVNLNDLPGTIQKNFFMSLELHSPPVPLYQPVGAGNILVAWGGSEPPGGSPSIADTQGNNFNPVYLANQTGTWYSDPAIGGAGDVVTITPAGGPNYACGGFVVELDSNTNVFDAQAHATGTSPTTPATCSITTTGQAGGIIFVALFLDGGFINGSDPPHWKQLFPNLVNNAKGNAFWYRVISGPGTYTFSFPTGPYTSYIMTMVAFTSAQAAAYPKALGNILDPKTALVARAGCRANGLFGSISLDSQKKAADWLADFYACANSAPVWSGFVLKSIFRSEVSAVGNGVVYTAPTASGPVMNITEDDLIGDPGGPLITVGDKAPGISDDEDNENYILQIEFLDRDSDYNPSVASWPEQASVAQYGPRKGTPQVLHEITSSVVAQKLLAIQARRHAYVIPRTFKFKGMAHLCLLEPMDLVTINDSLLGISALPVRITSVAEDDKHNFDFEAEPFFYGVHAPDPEITVTSTAPYQPNTNNTPASVNTPIIFEPVLRLSGGTAQLWAAVSDADPNYGGCAVYLSTDGGTSYNPIPGGTIFGNSMTGVTTADWPSSTDPDTTHDLPVDLTESLGSLLSYQVSDEDNFVYPCYVAGGNATIPYGLMTYAVATLTAANKYTLKATGGGTNHLRRCLYGAPAVGTDVDHPNGSRWALLNPAGVGLFKINLDPKWIGKTLYFKFPAFNTFQGGQQSVPSATAYAYTPTGLPSQSTANPSNSYVQSPAIALSQPSDVQISMAQVSVQFATNIVNYNARNFTIPDPGGTPTTYYVTIADTAQLGDTGALTNLTATCQTSNALVGVPGNTYIGFIIATHAAGATATPAPGGWPPPQAFIVN
jgi:hypothetical protein